jgi:hypothetical protein
MFRKYLRMKNAPFICGKIASEDCMGDILGTGYSANDFGPVLIRLRT